VLGQPIVKRPVLLDRREMMKSVIVAAVSLNQTPMDWGGNLLRIQRAIESARNDGARLICFPELCIPGYGCEDMFFAENTLARSLASLSEIIESSSGVTCAVGLPLKINGRLYNSVALVSDGKLCGFALKHYLAREGVYYEPRWFHAWEIGLRDSIQIAGATVPVGDLVFEVDDVKIAFEICEDAWVPKRFGEEFRESGVDIFLNPSASHFAFGKEEIRREIVTSGSKRFNCAYVYANLLGNDSGRLIYDGSRIIANKGELISEAELFSFAEIQISKAELELEPIPSSYPTVKCSGRLLSDATGLCSVAVASPKSKSEEFLGAVSLGLYDYMRRSRSKGFVVSLSGGVDSSAVSLLAAASLRLAAKEFGLQGLKERLNYWKEIQQISSVDELIRLGLSCVYQATVNSGSQTQIAAESLAKEIGATFLRLDISKLVEGYLALLGVDEIAALSLPGAPTWEKNDVALQNIQARTRGPGVWLIANLKGALLLATSNRSEASVGYTTMDGDTCGGLSPVAGVDKPFLREWLRWMESSGSEQFGPLTSLRLVNEQEPTAELRPPDKVQRDEEDLMPYPVLDAIERAAIKDKRTPVAMLPELLLAFPQYNEVALTNWVKKFHRLWAQNQWKRERYAPSFHLDDKSVDPKTWCRFPILSAGYEEEIKELGE